MQTHQKGFSVIEILLVVVVVGLIGVVGWLVYDHQNSKAAQTANTQVGTTQKAPNEGYVVVKEWGLRFKAPSGLADIKYAIHGDTLAFFAKPSGSSVQYRSDYDKFANGGFQYATGVAYRSSSATNNDRGFTIDGKKVGNYYYYTAWSFSGLASGAACVEIYGDSSDSNCQAEATAFQLVNQGDNSLLSTIELAQ
jgi:prepilin-type N-terminal cleavage/methylation domain-containing protein